MGGGDLHPIRLRLLLIAPPSPGNPTDSDRSPPGPRTQHALPRARPAAPKASDMTRLSQPRGRPRAGRREMAAAGRVAEVPAGSLSRYPPFNLSFSSTLFVINRSRSDTDHREKLNCLDPLLAFCNPRPLVPLPLCPFRLQLPGFGPEDAAQLSTLLFYSLKPMFGIVRPFPPPFPLPGRRFPVLFPPPLSRFSRST